MTTQQTFPAPDERYARQLGLPEIGAEGMERLRRARVLLVGAGGLGSPVALYLAGAGVGHLCLVDNDVVQVTNLHRQILYSTPETGLGKAECAARRLRTLNPDTEVEAVDGRFCEANAEALVARADVVVDGSDNFATRYLLSDTTARLGKPYVYGAVRGFQGQCAVFNAAPRPRTYRDLYPTEPPAPADKSLVGMTPAVIGSVEAHETLKLLCGYGTPLAGRLWSIDLRDMRTFLFDI